ncbi:phage XkdN-like protein [Clostridium puniceum]|uniref:Phage XkdN-like protein n=1 Tax=Clostridium puniceum TaxID=29367 RepID=A0A1S8TX78_9CLOT|nr:phage portal protein [Clostridium puniceum]OOM82331.1 phage XkdN-like protein [Clostridium puniceum]
MSNLSYFLSDNVVKEESVKYAATSRIVDEDKKPVEWEIVCITSEEDEAIRKSCTKKVPVPGKKNMYTPETDYDKYLGLLAVKCTLYPNLNNKELQDSYKVMGADTLLKTMLKPGEYQDFLAKVQEVNGFEVTLEDKVDEAKN